LLCVYQERMEVVWLFREDHEFWACKAYFLSEGLLNSQSLPMHLLFLD